MQRAGQAAPAGRPGWIRSWRRLEARIHGPDGGGRERFAAGRGASTPHP